VYNGGIILNVSDKEHIFIDSKSNKIPPEVISIVSHAHSDHHAALTSKAKIYTTKPTLELFTCEKPLIKNLQVNILEYHKPLELTYDQYDNVTITLISAGHILGSASVVVEQAGWKLLFSSDIGGKGLLTLKRDLDVVKANELIIEATFGSSNLSFPRREDISMNILKWTAEVIKKDMNAVFSAGKIGSAQELIKMFNNFTKVPVVTHGKVSLVSDIYKKNGIELTFYDSKSEEGREILKEGGAVVIQSRSKTIVPYFIKEHVKCKTAIVTGMTSRFPFREFDAAFSLSSHANYHELLEYIQKVDPEIVYTLDGYEKRFAKEITKELQIPAQPLKVKSKEPFGKYQTNKQIRIEKLKAKTIPEQPAIQNKNIKNQLSKKKPTTLDDFFKQK
jgi:putative mRNA 3-end processing factor